MPSRVAAIICCAAVALSLAPEAGAVSPVGNPIRVDLDPGGSFYGVGSYSIARTGNGGFAVLWGEDTEDNGFLNYEALRYRVFKADRKPVADPGKLDLSGLRPLFNPVSVVPLGTNKVYAVFSALKQNSGEEQAFGQSISTGNGAASARKLLCTIETGTTLSARIAALSNGKAVFACFGFNNPPDYSDIPGRFISPAGQPGAANLQFALDEDSFLSSLQTLGAGLLGYYPRTSLFNNTFETFGRVFKANGDPLGPAKRMPKAPDLAHLTVPSALSNNRILVRRFEKDGAKHKLTGQVFDSKWKSLVAPKTLLQQNGSYPGAAFTPLQDGGFLLWQRSGSGNNAKHSIMRFSGQLKKVGSTYTFKAIEGDTGRAVALDADTWIAIYRVKQGARERLVAQPLRN